MTTAPRTAASLRADIATVARQMNDWGIEGRLDSDTEADMLGEIADLEEELAEVEHPEWSAPTGGINIPLACRAFGLTEEELDKWLGEEAA